MQLDPQPLTVLVLTAVVLAAVALVVGLAALATARRAGRGGRGQTGAAVPPASNGSAEPVPAGDEDAGAPRTTTAGSVRHVAVVRYDAFDDVGGRLSFSAALLDEAGSGLVLTAISGREVSRSYAKELERGQSSQTLSPEEHQAVDAALGRRP